MFKWDNAVTKKSQTFMNKISTYMEHDHGRCDAQYALAEAQAARHAWSVAEREFARFRQLFDRHLDKEEQILFPQLERLPGNPARGPTTVMRSEHGQLRDIAALMAAALVARDSDMFFEHADTLRILMHQHNLKEESVLYPMADRLLHEHGDAVLAMLCAEQLAASA